MIIGNEENKKLLKSIIEKKNIAHSYMFLGQDGIGKILFAKEFAKSILCQMETKPCNKCKSCIEFDNLNNPDFIILEPEGNSIKINQIREMTKKVIEKPIISNKKVYIINDSNLMTKEAQNALLKTLEEPPEYVVIILIAENENSFLNTIKSRCTKVIFRKLKEEEIQKVLYDKNYKEIDKSIIKNCNGSVKRAIELYYKRDTYSKLDTIFMNLEIQNEIQVLSIRESLIKEKENINTLLEYINLIFFKKVRNNIKDSNKYVECIDIIEDTKIRLKKSANLDMTIDNFLYKILEVVNG